MADPVPLNRNQIAAFVGNDPASIRAMERLFKVAGDLVPADIAVLKELILENALAAGVADGKAETVLSAATVAERLAELLATAPVPQESQINAFLDALATAPAPSDPMLERLSDVDAFGASAGMVLIYDATQQRWTARTITAGSNIVVANADGSITVSTAGASGSFTAASLETVTVVDGIITSIV